MDETYYNNISIIQHSTYNQKETSPNYGTLTFIAIC